MKKKRGVTGKVSKPTGITSLLIANRGEIACRIARTCKELGIRSVAIFSDVDRYARHVRIADEARALGGVELKETYLNPKRILALAADCDAIHPGYGFLSENSAFAKSCAASNKIFVGPSHAVMEQSGNKLSAKAAAVKAKVPVLPVLEISSFSTDHSKLTEYLKANPFPLLVKAAGGGGGRGMRLVVKRDELPAAIEAASREAQMYFHDPRVFLEPAVSNARHIEVQILGDNFGEIVALGDRDCSLQRRHQKIIEEAPASKLSPALRREIQAAAVRLGKALGYENAGTVEFLVAGNRFYFLEINARLQVEHPVTEAVYGVDLVALQLQVAEGKRLSQIFPTRKRKLKGHAIEVRICAEDPESNFTPSSGTVEAFSVDPAVRCDTGYEVGDTIPAEYDSLLGKVIVHGATREAARKKLVETLARIMLAGVKSNLSLLRSLLEIPEFLSASHSTKFLDGYLKGYSSKVAPEILNAVNLLAHSKDRSDPWQSAIGFRLGGKRRISDSITLEGDTVRIQSKNGESLLAKGELASAEVFQGSNGYWTNFRGGIHFTPYPDRTRRTPSAQLSGTELAGDFAEIRAPLPGKVLSLAVREGDRIESGALVATLESMKMEHRVVAVASGTVATIAVAVGESVTAGKLLLSIS